MKDIVKTLHEAMGGKQEDVEEAAVETPQEIAEEEQPRDRSAYNCPECAGEGLDSHQHICQRCGGTGKV